MRSPGNPQFQPLYQEYHMINYSVCVFVVCFYLFVCLLFAFVFVCLLLLGFCLAPGLAKTELCLSVGIILSDLLH